MVKGQKPKCEICGCEIEDIKACRQKCKGCGREIDCEDSGFV